MSQNSKDIKRVSSFCLLLVFCIFINAGYLPAQPYPMPVLPDTSKLGQYTSRTMNLLHNNTPGKRNDIRILVYGQSISEQEWWLEVKREIMERFPDANLIMENKAIGGFSTQYLFKTVEMDVCSFYPDLVLLHIYGNNKDYEAVLNTIRSRTAAEVAIMTDHYIGENRWSDTMCYHILPSLAEKYKCDIINIRDPWKAYLKDNNLETAALLRDGTHLNDFGNFLMAELVKPLFCYKSSYPDDPFTLVKIYRIGSDINLNGDTISVHFIGNRADLIYVATGVQGNDSMSIILDGKPPLSFQGCYYITRPYNEKGKAWPWDLPAMIRISHITPWVAEEWTCVYSKAKAPYLDVKFSISGSVTGKDGNGSVNHDFISRSGRVIINKGDAENGGDWHLNRSYKVLKTVVKSGDSFKWKTYAIGTDVFKPELSDNAGEEKEIILFQGVPNTDHDIRIAAMGKRIPSIAMIRVYRPYWNR
jgi:hypothetical protein